MTAKLQQLGFKEKQFTNKNVTINYVVGPNKPQSLVLIPAQIGTWESYEAVLPELAKQFKVYAVDIRGHGKSSWTTGEYSWSSVGKDMIAFLEQVVTHPAIISGNSSGGIIALWLGAYAPHLASGIILEDAPLFSAEMPRFKEKDKYVYKGLEQLVENIGDMDNRNIANYFNGLELPLKNGRVKRIPKIIIPLLSFFINKHKPTRPNTPIDIPYFPSQLRLLIKSLSQFDPDFAQAFVDGRFYGDVSHEELLKKVHCPILLLHANWFRHPTYGLIGAMDDTDAQQAMKINPGLQYKKIEANHVIHLYKPKEFIKALEEFCQKNNLY